MPTSSPQKLPETAPVVVVLTSGFSLMAPDSGLTSRYRWCEQLTNGHDRGIALHSSRVIGRSTSSG